MPSRLFAPIEIFPQVHPLVNIGPQIQQTVDHISIPLSAGGICLTYDGIEEWGMSAKTFVVYNGCGIDVCPLLQ